EQAARVVDKVRKHLGSLRDCILAVFGLSYKPDTDDVRESPAVRVCQLLLEQGACLRVHDPVVKHVARLSHVEPCRDAYEACVGADGVLVLTEWNEFRNLDLERIYESLAGKLLFDMRNIYDPREAARLGFVYEGMGRTAVANPTTLQDEPVPIGVDAAAD